MATVAGAGFVLKKQKGRIAHLNVRDEKHGEEVVLAVDVKVVLEMGNKVLDMFSPGLRAALYAPEGEPALVDGEDHLTVLRFPQLEPLKWEAAGLAGAEFIVHGPKKDDDLSFNGDVDKVRLEPKEGGTVEVTFSVAVRPTPEINGELSSFLGKDAKVSLRPVEQPSQPPLES